MKPLQAVENLDNLSKQGVEVDMGALVSMLSAPEQAFYSDELYEHGADIDEDILYKNETVIKFLEDSQNHLEVLQGFLDNGADTNIIIEKDSIKINPEYFSLLMSHGADINKITARLNSEQKMNHKTGLNNQNNSNELGISNSLSEAARATLQEDLRRTLEEGKEAHPELPDEYFEFIKKVLKNSQSNGYSSTLPASPTPPDLPTSGQMSSEVHGA